MPAGRSVFRVSVAIDRAWAFVSDMAQVGRCVPGCEQVEVLDERRSRWLVQAQLGPLTRQLQMEATTVVFDAPEHGAFLARGRDLETRGDIRLRAISASETEVTYQLEARALGFGRTLVEAGMALVIQEQADQFARNVQAALAA